MVFTSGRPSGVGNGRRKAFLTYSCFTRYNILFLKKKYAYINIRLTHSDAYLVRFT